MKPFRKMLFRIVLVLLASHALAGSALFGPSVDYPAGVQPFAAATADLNGDGILDLVVTNNSGGTTKSTIAVLLGNGDGSFRSPVFYTVDPRPTSVAIADFNGDGKPDLAVASYLGIKLGNGVISVLLGNGDGTFQSAHNYPAGQSPYFVALADLNGDGKPDMLAANNGGGAVGLGYVSVVIGNGNGSFQKPLDLNSGKVPQGLVVGDFNGDGKVDVAVANQCYINCQKGAISILLGKGDGTFQKAVTTSISSDPTFIAASDLNGDGKLDLVAVESSSNIAILLGKGDGTFGLEADIAVARSPESVAVGDFDGDGFTDLATANHTSSNVSVLLGKGDGTFQSPITFDLGIADNPFYVITGDFNGDHKLDLAVTKGTGYVSILLNTAP